MQRRLARNFTRLALGRQPSAALRRDYMMLDQKFLAYRRSFMTEAFPRIRELLSSKFPKGFGKNVTPSKKAGGKSNPRGRAKPKQTPESGGFPEWMPFVALLGALGLIFSVVKSRSSANGLEVDFQTFRNNYLRKGIVDHIEVENNTFVKAYLRKQPLPRSGAGAGYDSEFEDEPVDSYQQQANIPEGINHVYFNIGSLETFERHLEDAQFEMGVPPKDFVPVKYTTPTDMGETFVRLLPGLLFLGLWILIAYRMSRGGGGITGGTGGGGGGGGMGNIFNIGKAQPKLAAETDVAVTFKDVAGCDEAKAEVMEFVEFLKDPARFTKLGARMPKGGLLVGPPGTGKTLLAKAVAGEASVPFFSMSGSDFIEMFVGVGPSRVRDLFKQARDSAPCIVFIDEVDAVARARGKGMFGGANDERESTLNQLLVEMDGFSSGEGVVVLASTNRVDILDKAILRPGRFDRQITVDKPDIRGREQIFNVHLKSLKLGGDPEKYAQRLAALTPGFVGADIANICNEAAIVAARAAKDVVDIKDFEAATDRVIGGLAKNNHIMSEEERRTVAYHEAGHAVAGWFLKYADPLLKVTIVPRASGALGFAQYLPKEMSLLSTEAILDKMCMTLGGRASEEINFDRITTGASDDLDKVTQMAYAMTTIYGMNPKLGNLSFPPKEEQQFNKPYSEETARLIDEEVRALVERAYNRTKTLLEEKKDAVKAIAEELLVKETINQNDIVRLVGDRPFPIDSGVKQYLESGWRDEEDRKIKEREEALRNAPANEETAKPQEPDSDSNDSSGDERDGPQASRTKNE